MIDFTTLIAVDNRHVEQLKLTWPTWRRFRPEILQQPFVVICDDCRPLTEWSSKLDFVDHPQKRLVSWAMAGVSQREKMLSSFVFIPGREISTPWYLKLDTDVVASSATDWVPSKWFEADDHGRLPVFVSSPWGYTKPAAAIAVLDDWGDSIPELQAFPRLNLPFEAGSTSVYHSRIISWCFFGQTRWTAEMASLCRDRLPVPSQDTYLWYCAKRRQEYFRTQRMTRCGWSHIANQQRLRRSCQQAVLRPSVSSCIENIVDDRLAPSPKIPPQAAQILELISSMPSGPLRGAEVGVLRGETSCALLESCERLHLFLVDPWKEVPVDHSYRKSGDKASQLTSIEHDENARLADCRTWFARQRRTILRLSSVEAARQIPNGSLDFAFIDGDHTHEAVCQDIEAWWPKVRSGGYLMGHDYFNRRNRTGQFGVRRAVDEWVAQSTFELKTGRGSVWWVRKTEQAARSRPSLSATPLSTTTPHEMTTPKSTSSTGVIYLLSGVSHATRLLVSLWSLRKHWSGPVVLFTTDEMSHNVGMYLAMDSRLAIHHEKMTPARTRRNRSYCTKTLLPQVTPFDWTLYLDADTLVVGSLNELFRASPLVLTQFSNWISTGRRVKKRIESWKGLNCETDRLVERALATSWPAINTGVFGFHRDLVQLARWRELAAVGHRQFIVDEIAMQLLYPEIEQCRVVDDRWNRSVTYHATTEDTRIWHFHGDRHLRKPEGSRHWLPAFQACWGEDLGGVVVWGTPPSTALSPTSVRPET